MLLYNRKSILLLFLIIAYPYACLGQSDTLAFITVADSGPNFDGGEAGLTAFLQKNLDYPPKALDKGTKGRVYITFIVDTVGNISNIKILKDIGDGCGEEAVRVIEKMNGKWTPAYKNGQKANFKFNLPVFFNIGGESVNPNELYNDGVALLKNKEFAEAKKKFTAVLTINSRDIDALYNRAIASLQLEQIEDACNDLGKAMALGDKESVKLLDKYCRK